MGLPLTHKYLVNSRIQLDYGWYMVLDLQLLYTICPEMVTKSWEREKPGKSVITSYPTKISRIELSMGFGPAGGLHRCLAGGGSSPVWLVPKW